MHCLAGWLASLADWLAGWLADWRLGKLLACLADWQLAQWTLLLLLSSHVGNVWHVSTLRIIVHDQSLECLWVLSDQLK